MNINQIAQNAEQFFVENRGRMGFSYGIFVGAAVMYWHMKSTQMETELVVTDQDAKKMLDEDQIAVYQTKYGPIFMAMHKETTNQSDDGGLNDSEVS